LNRASSEQQQNSEVDLQKLCIVRTVNQDRCLNRLCNGVRLHSEGAFNPQTQGEERKYAGAVLKHQTNTCFAPHTHVRTTSGFACSAKLTYNKLMFVSTVRQHTACSTATKNIQLNLPLAALELALVIQTDGNLPPIVGPTVADPQHLPARGFRFQPTFFVRVPRVEKKGKIQARAAAAASNQDIAAQLALTLSLYYA
jgi:hypothetical protein